MTDAQQAADAPAGSTPVEQFAPTLREVLLRPRWLAMLGLALVVAGIFAWLGQWQLGRSIDLSPPPPGATEQVRPIDEVVQPAQYLPEPLVGQRVDVEGRWIPGDFLVVTSRYNDNVLGYWVTGQLRVSDAAEPASLAVAVGWTADRATADAAAARLDEAATSDPDALVSLSGRVISDEGPGLPPTASEPLEMPRMSPAALLARWHDVDGVEVYRPYLTSTDPLGGLEVISSPAPAEGSTVNWLNIFYAAEWAVFAGFAFYLWYRLAKDAWEKEVEDLEDAAAAAS